ncbi:unnamed protein product [Phytophthora fragariaefolia]|uniref:Unnamed protein product n=1 Tax=Phytophthora fragariaefolia TaxID=1490495 RepID=A0A9W7D3J6_9STRA|nr:unnamed protein product [Phytophthora fragariaefolia]
MGCEDLSLPRVSKYCPGCDYSRYSRRGAPPAGDAVECVDIEHTVSKTASPSDSHSHCKKQDDKPKLVILKVNPEREREVASCIGGPWCVGQLSSTTEPS